MRKTITILSIFISLSSCKYTTENKYPDCGSNDIEKMDTCLLGLTFKQVIDKLNLDSSQYISFEEPPGIKSGFLVTIKDSFNMELWIDSSINTIYYRRSELENNDSLKENLKNQYSMLFDRKIVGVIWWKYNSKKRGQVFIKN